MPTKRDGTKVSWRQFFHEWKEGMEKVTPLQQAQITQWGFLISSIGVIWGIIFSFRIGYYWMMIILIGGFIVLTVQFLGNWQKKQLLKRMDEAMKIADNYKEETNGTTRIC